MMGQYPGIAANDSRAAKGRLAPRFSTLSLNTDASTYGGGNLGNGSAALEAEALPWMNRAHSLSLTLPPLAGILLVHEA